LANTRSEPISARRPVGQSERSHGSLRPRAAARTRGEWKPGLLARRPSRQTGRRRAELREWANLRCGHLPRPGTCSSVEALLLQSLIGGASGHGALAPAGRPQREAGSAPSKPLRCLRSGGLAVVGQRAASLAHRQHWDPPLPQCRGGAAARRPPKSACCSSSRATLDGNRAHPRFASAQRRMA
jgi:hypothetical protein